MYVYVWFVCVCALWGVCSGETGQEWGGGVGGGLSGPTLVAVESGSCGATPRPQ